MTLRTALPQPLAAFLRELSPFGGEPVVGPMYEAFAALADEGLGNEDAEKLLLAITRVAGQPTPLRVRLDAIADLLSQKGRVVVTIGRNTHSIVSRPS